jgi:hypothetical protein
MQYGLFDVNPVAESQRVQTLETQVMQPLLLAGQSGISSHVPLGSKYLPAIQTQICAGAKNVKLEGVSHTQLPVASITKLVAVEQLVQTVADEHK